MMAVVERPRAFRGWGAQPAWSWPVAAVRLGIGTALALLLTASESRAQPAPAVPATPPTHSGASAQPHSGAAHHHAPAIEIEAGGSSVFQFAMLGIRLGPKESPVFFDTHGYGVDTNEVGITGLAWEFRLGSFRLLPGLGWAFGRENKPSLAGTARWAHLGDTWVTEGLFVHSFEEQVPEASSTESGAHEESEEMVRHAGVMEGHLSRRVGPVELGPLVEHIRYREENEWKGGARVAWRVGRGVRLLAMVLAPDPEARVGIAWER